MRIEDLARVPREGRVVISDHAEEEAPYDGLSFEEIYFSVNHGEVIEEYATDRPHPGCLVYGDTFGGDPVHSVWGYNGRAGFAVLITVYRPDPSLWSGTGRSGGGRRRHWRGFKETFEVCPICGGELAGKGIEKLLKGGPNVATVTVEAIVCLRRGERFYPERTVKRFEEIRARLASDRTEGLALVGGAYEAR